tara:strand:+ start:158214 stop:158615 length:402 start_codon:yes stop_codon:yes gene_type:complete
MGYYFLFIGAMISLFAVWSTLKLVWLLMTGERTQGRIVGFDQKLRSVGDKKRLYYHARIEFHTISGEPVLFTYGYGSAIQPGEIGQNMPVIYALAAPEKAVVNSFMGVWAGPLAVTVLGVGCLYAGIDIVFGT